MNWMEWIVAHPGIAFAPFVLLMLFGGHAIADYGQQSAYVAEFKARPMTPERIAVVAARQAAAGQPVTARAFRNPDWFVTLGAHCLIHAGIVGGTSAAFLLLAGRPLPVVALVAAGLGWTEFLLHFVIDDAKGQHAFSYRTDQALHYLCKIVWAAILLAAAVA